MTSINYYYYYYHHYYYYLLPVEHRWRQISEACDVANYGSGWRKDVVTRCLKFNTIALHTQCSVRYSDKGMETLGYIEERGKSEREKISRTDENSLLGPHNLPIVKLEQYEEGDFLDQWDFLSYRTDSEEIDRYVQGDFLGPWEYIYAPISTQLTVEQTGHRLIVETEQNE